jgi:hypothetical protein
MKESKASEEDLALKEMTSPMAREAQEQAREREQEKQEHICELSRALAVLASASVRRLDIKSFELLRYYWLILFSQRIQLFFPKLISFLFLQSVSREREEFLRLVNKEVFLCF